MKEAIRRINIRSAKKEGMSTDFDEDEGGVSYHQISPILRDHNHFAVPAEKIEQEIQPGILFSSRVVALEKIDGEHPCGGVSGMHELHEGVDFANVYDLSVSQDVKDLSSEIVSLARPIHMHRFFINDKQVVATINGGFLYVSDDTEGIGKKGPKEPNLNWCIRNGVVTSLPAADRPAVFTIDGKLQARNVIARGEIGIGAQMLNWMGGEPLMHTPHGKNPKEYDPNVVTLFNPACAAIVYKDPNDKRSPRGLDLNTYYTPTNPDVVALTVEERDGALIVSDIKDGGGVGLFEGNFILHVPKSQAIHIVKGDRVVPRTLDGLNMDSIQSALTIGPDVHYFLDHDDHPINYDYSLGTFPPFHKSSRYARSVIYEDLEGNIHLTVINGAPRSDHFKGATPHEVAQIIPRNVHWAFFLDGGQSSRLAYKNAEGSIEAEGNKQYVRLTAEAKERLTNVDPNSAPTDYQFLWTRRGRPVPSVIAIRREVQHDV